jgi:aquaporin Z
MLIPVNINTFRPATAVATEKRPAVVAKFIGTWRKYATEAIGTFFLVFTVGASIRSGSALAPLGIGAVLMTMVYAGGHISGAHYNPAVTLAVLVRGRIGRSDAIRYWVAQVGAGAIAAVVVRVIVSPGQVRPLAWSGQAIVAAFLAELLVTFALCYVVLNVATSKDHPNNSFYGLAIGFTVASGAIAVGGISGGVFNPAVAFAGVLTGMVAGPALWLYLVAQLVAGAAAGVVFRALNPGDK